MVQAQQLYAFYYSRSPGRDVEINLLNTTSEPTQYQVHAYDVWGNQIWEATGDLAAKDATFYLLSEQIAEDAANWGVLTVTSAERLVIAPEYFVNGQAVAFDIINRAVSGTTAGSAYQLVLYHTEVAESNVGLIVMNPWDQEVSGRLVIYRSDGSPLGQAELKLTAYEAKFFNIAQLVGQGSRNWGVVEVVVNQRPVVAASTRLMGGGIQIKNVTEAWTVEEVSPTGTPGVVTPPKKED